MNIILESGPKQAGSGVLRARLAGLARQEAATLPALPEAALRLVEMAGKPLADVRALTRLVQADPRVESRVLRVAQSAAFQPSCPVTSLGEAIAWLGAGEVAEMAFTAAVHGALFDGRGSESPVLERWRASIAAAVWSREIAAVSRRRSRATYLCGLLHDLGFHLARLACMDAATSVGTVALAEDEDDFVRQQGPRLGELAAQQWSLPQAVKECIAGWASWSPGHDQPEQLAVVHLAHHLAEIATLQGPEFAREALSGNAVLDELNISPDRFTALLDRSTWVLDQVRAY